jgi:hypothetical protein
MAASFLTLSVRGCIPICVRPQIPSLCIRALVAPFSYVLMPHLGVPFSVSEGLRAPRASTFGELL